MQLAAEIRQREIRRLKAQQRIVAGRGTRAEKPGIAIRTGHGWSIHQVPESGHVYVIAPQDQIRDLLTRTGLLSSFIVQDEYSPES